jgi:uncharacterized membrane protein YbaN (DUF454 family)
VAAKPRSPGKRWAIIGLGWTFVLLGIAGLFLPLLQGVIFLFVGLVLLAREQAWARRLLDRLKQRFPRLAASAEAAEDRAKAMMHRIAERFGRSGR